MTVYLVGAGPGDPGLLTRRAAELLAQADVVVHDRLVHPAVLAMAPPDAEVVDVGKRPGAERRQEEINALLIDRAQGDRTVVRLKGGDPFVFGRGGEEALALRAAGVSYEVVPGVTAAFAAPAYAGVPVTHRGLSTSVTVVTGRVGDLSSGGVDWEALAQAGGTLVVLMGMEQRAEIAARLMEGGRPPDTPVLVVEQGTMSSQRAEHTTLAKLYAVSLGAPASIVVGAVAALDLAWYTPGPLAGRRVVVTRAARRAGGMAELLEAAGAQVLRLPVVETADPEDGWLGLATALADLSEVEWIVFTSAVAVDRALAHVRDGRALAGVRLAAVGRVTAKALSARSLVADLVADPATARGLVACMPARTGRKERPAVLYPRAAGARDVVVRGLEAKGWEVRDVVAYRTVAVGHSLPPQLLDEATSADAVTFTSASTVHALMAALGDRGLPPVIACIGPVTAEAARQAGLEVTVVAEEHSAEGLVQALVDRLGEH